jgi:site-specific DNA-methyltransferase (adenine-specific)
MTPEPFTLEITQDAPAVFHAPPCSGSLDLRLGDCMDVMKTFPDGYFDLAIVDPPYGIGVNSMNMGSRKTVRPDKKNWDDEIPTPEYFAELRRVAKKQIVWGGNYFPLPPSRGWCVWDKGESMYGRSFAEVELAWMSMDASARIFKMSPNQLDRFHPTQKPVKLYEWLLGSYAKPGERILDTHLGSGSHAIAAHYYGVHLTACEIDAEYFEAAKARIARETSQLDLFIHHNAGVLAQPGEISTNTNDAQS